MSDSKSIDHVARILKRAADRMARNAQKRVEQATKRNPFTRLGRVTQLAFADTLSKALKIHGAKQHGQQRFSIRLTAPDTGGRPFHMDYTTVSRASIALSVGRTDQSDGRVRKRKTSTSVPGSHMAYIERPEAAEMPGASAESAAHTVDGPEQAPGRMQTYLENDAKTSSNVSRESARAAGEHGFSFGTPEMGKTLEERIAFWDLVEKHAKGPGSTIQRRLILELPHECSPEDRLEIMRAFTDKYDHDRVPYWCVLHAPQAGKNDDRNFHAHIVLANTPAWQIDWEADGVHDGTLKPMAKVWNFAARTYGLDKSKHLRTLYRQRQNVREDYRRGFVENERKRFTSIVNTQMESSGVPIRYDHRSYKAMGLEVNAMSSVKRMLLEKSKAGERVILDAGRTKRLVDHEIARIARERSTDLAEVERIRRAVRKSSARLHELDREALRLGRRAGLAKWASIAVRRAYTDAALRYARLREAQVRQEIASRFEIENLRRHVDATQIEPFVPLRAKIEESLGRARKEEALAQESKLVIVPGDVPGRSVSSRTTQIVVENLRRELDALPDLELLALINREARVELDRLEKAQAKSLSQTQGIVANALRNWKMAGTGIPAEVEMPAYTEAAARPPIHNPALVDELSRKPKSHLRHYPESAHAMIDQMFSTPYARAALDITNHLSDHIKAAAKLKIKGKDTVQIVREEVQALSKAFATGPAEGLLLLAQGPRDRTPTESAADIPHGQAAAPRLKRGGADEASGVSRTSVSPSLSLLSGNTTSSAPDDAVTPTPDVVMERSRRDQRSWLETATNASRREQRVMTDPLPSAEHGGVGQANGGRPVASSKQTPPASTQSDGLDLQSAAPAPMEVADPLNAAPLHKPAMSTSSAPTGPVEHGDAEAVAEAKAKKKKDRDKLRRKALLASKGRGFSR